MLALNLLLGLYRRLPVFIAVPLAVGITFIGFLVSVFFLLILRPIVQKVRRQWRRHR